MMRQREFLMKYKEQGAERSGGYGQALRRSCSQKLSCPLGLRQKWRTTSSNLLPVEPLQAYEVFLLFRPFWQQRNTKILLG
jgi:hypothetical protein